MHTLPTTTPSPGNTPVSSEKLLVGNHTPQEEEEEGCVAKSPQEEEAEIAPFRYKPRAGVLSRSFRSHESAASRLVAIRRREAESNSNSSADVSHSSKLAGGESESGPDSHGHSSVSEESSACNSVEGSKTELSVESVAGSGSGKREELTVKSQPLKTHPYSKRIEISPRSSSPNVQRLRPRILSKADTENRLAKTGPALLARRSTLSSIPSGRRLLPAPPMRRGSRPMLVHANSISPSSEKSSPPPSAPAANPNNNDSSSEKVNGETVDSFPTKLVSLLEDVATKENSSHDNNSFHDNTSDVNPESAASSSEYRLHATPNGGSSSSINSREEQLSGSKVKHTVQYKNSALTKKGKHLFC